MSTKSHIFYSPGNYIGFGGRGLSAGPSPTFSAIAATPTANGNGGLLNSASPNHCVDDQFTKTRIGTPTGVGANFLNAGTATGQYSLNPGVFQGGVVGTGHQITLYVDGNVTIKHNITYQAGWDATDRSTIPYFMLIVRGNIDVDPAVTQLDGLYIAQPNGAGTGEFHTCNIGAAHFCTSQLVVNGAVIAQAIRLERVHGTLHGSAQVAGQPAEIFNYSPLLVLGEPYIKQTQGTPPLQGLYSLPPVF